MKILKYMFNFLGVLHLYIMEKENCDPKTRVDQARQPGKAVGPREGKLRFQTT